MIVATLLVYVREYSNSRALKTVRWVGAIEFIYVYLELVESRLIAQLFSSGPRKWQRRLKIRFSRARMVASVLARDH